MSGFDSLSELLADDEEEEEEEEEVVEADLLLEESELESVSVACPR